MAFSCPLQHRPELAEAKDEIFEQLAWKIRPEVIQKHVTKGVKIAPFCLGMFLMRGAASGVDTAAAPVRVLHEQRVAGYDATVLEADDPAALSKRLNERGYAESDSLKEWLTPYVSAHWKLTAFKIASETPSNAIGTSAVRMSFKTDRPFFPYREPSNQRDTSVASKPASERSRLLRVFFVNTRRRRSHRRWVDSVGRQVAAVDRTQRRWKHMA
ncbi:MAG: DUF2330 domain-containing protein [Polyangiaceae bacterium]